MSRIDELVRVFCPNGVPVLTMAEAGQTYAGLSGKTKSDFGESGSLFVSYLTVANSISLPEAIETRVLVAPTENQNQVLGGDLLLTGSSEDFEGVGLACEVRDTPAETTYLNSFCIGWRPRDGLFARGFLGHAFRTPEIRDQLRRRANGVTRINLSKKRLQSLVIPAPALEVQEEIVRILDTFTELEAELEAEIEAELEARKTQYEETRNRLMDLDAVESHPLSGLIRDLGLESFEVRPLGDLVEYLNGKAHEKLVDPEGTIPLITARFISRNGEANRFLLQEDVKTPGLSGDIALVLSDLPNGRALARTFFIDRDNAYAINQRIARLRVRDNKVLNPRFVHYFLDRNPNLLAHDNGVDQTHLSKSQITSLAFPLLPLALQNEIVRILDAFESLVSDLSSGLPAEIAARRKQYEYYRDKLLTFEELAA